MGRTLQVTQPPEQGDDVRVLQQLLGVPVTGIYDEASANAVYRKKLELGYQKPDHAAGDLLYDYLRHTKQPTAAMVRRAADYRKQVGKAGGTTTRPVSVKPTPVEQAAAREAAVRAKAVTVMNYLIANNPKVHYPPGDKRTMTVHQIATMEQLEAAVATGRFTLDCSQSVTLIAHVAGAKDPNGQNYASDGYTGTLLSGSQTVPRGQAQPGDLVVFGPGTGHHVCMVLQTGADPLLFSHGQENDPIHISESIEAKYQPAGIRYLRLSA